MPNLPLIAMLKPCPHWRL